jgi:hypothetical protein
LCSTMLSAITALTRSLIRRSESISASSRSAPNGCCLFFFSACSFCWLSASHSDVLCGRRKPKPSTFTHDSLRIKHIVHEQAVRPFLISLVFHYSAQFTDLLSPSARHRDTAGLYRCL